MKKCALKISIFDFGFILYFLTLFIDDLALDNITVGIKGIRYVAYMLFVIHIVSTNRIKNRQLLYFLIAFSGGIGISLLTHDVYWAIAALMVLAVRKIDPVHIVKLSYCILLIATMITVLMALAGLIPMSVNIHRRAGETIVRYGMGFYHSNVLPLIVFYLMIYRMLIYGRKIKIAEIVLWNCLSIVVYNICYSRNGLYAILLCGVLYSLYIRLTKKKTSVSYKKILKFFAKYSIYICIVFSMLMTAIQGMGLNSIWQINKFFTGRFAIAYHQIEESGIYLINILSKEEYKLVARVLDNGYLFVVLRYGILFLLFYIIMQRNILKKYPFDTIIHIVMICVVITNMIDNDFYSYGFLPIIVLAFSDYTLKYKNSQKGQIDAMMEMQYA
ncbi:MAG: hypothetical protein HFH97_08340 [Lachnospiraceae bacterium]|nr:hypothetical protein [uncultured Acetatifactor sp.]MCI9572604.1 hypothetical protein [Lachnospiraceae bacterium]